MNDAKRIERMLEAIGRALAEDSGAVVEPSVELDMLQPLEAAVALLLAELAETKRRNHEQILEIRAKNREITDRQAQRLRELSTPIIAVWDGLLAQPLVGLIDAERGQALIEAVLSMSASRRTSYLLAYT